MSKFSNRLKIALDENKMKPAQLSEKTGLSQALISQYLNDKFEPKNDKIAIIAKCLDVNPLYLMGWTDDFGTFNSSTNSIVHDRIKSRRKELGMTQEQLAFEVGYKSESEINKIENGENEFPYNQLFSFAFALNTTPEYLQGLTDNPLDIHRIASDLEVPEELWPNMDKEVRTLKYINLLEDHYKISTSDLHAVQIPLYSSISCGNGIFIDDNIIEYISLPNTILKPNREYYAQYANGDSMIDEGINDGDLLIFEKVPTLENGQVGCFCIDHEETLCKKFYNDGQFITLQSANPNYPPKVIDVTSTNFTIVGKLSKVIHDFEK